LDAVRNFLTTFLIFGVAGCQPLTITGSSAPCHFYVGWFLFLKLHGSRPLTGPSLENII
jgi:hypothetical protein